MSYPLPPVKTNRDPIYAVPAPDPTPIGDVTPYTSPPLPPLPEIKTVSGRLTEDETSFILQTTLKPIHHDDPNVLRFIACYINCRDTRQAAREAGLDPRSGVNLRNRPDIYAAITKLTEKSVMKYGFDASEVIEKVKEIAGIDPIEFENADGSYKTKLSEIAPESRRAIKKFKCKNIYGHDPNGMHIVTGQIIEVELWDKMKAIEFLGREKDLFVEKKKVEHDVSGKMASILLDSERRAEQRQISASDNSREVIQIEARKVDE